MSINEYFRKMKEIYDALIVSDQSISEEELISFIINRLQIECHPTIVHLLSKIDSEIDRINLIETNCLFQKYEQRIIQTSWYVFDLQKGVANLSRQVNGNELGQLRSRNVMNDRAVYASNNSPIESQTSYSQQQPV